MKLLISFVVTCYTNVNVDDAIIDMIKEKNPNVSDAELLSLYIEEMQKDEYVESEFWEEVRENMTVEDIDYSDCTVWEE